jgi:hypothetical protein
MIHIGSDPSTQCEKGQVNAMMMEFTLRTGSVRCLRSSSAMAQEAAKRA